MGDKFNMKLFLSSSFEKTAGLLESKIGRKIKGKKVIFIENASDNHTGDIWWIRTDREAFLKLGCDIVDTDLRNISKDDFTKLLKDSDIIHFCGGSVLYLINLIKEKGLKEIIVDAVKKNKIVYTGTSAGSMVVSTDLSLCAFDQDEKDEYKKKENYCGLALLNFLILPHSNNIDFTGANIKMVEKLSNFSQPVIFIYDNQAVFVEDDKFEILSA